jgi:endonuclease/exonuclease/phosphatase family metal-dependent hydrolase
MTKKSRIRSFSKKIFLIVQLLLTFLFLYPLFIKPLPLIWINGFLGLLAPYIVIAQLLLIIFWLLAKPPLSLIPLITLAIGWETLFSLVALHPGISMSQKKKDNTCRVISWNVKGFNGNQPTRTLKLRAQDIAYSIQKWNPDIICLQEYNTNDRPNDIANHASYFNKNYPFNYFSKDIQNIEKSYYLGCIIFSKYRIIKAQRIPYTNKESLIYVDILKGDDTIRIFTTHLASYRFKQNDFIALATTAKADSLDINGKKGVLRKMRTAFIERAVQAQIVKKYLDESPYPTIITGDFNDVPSSYTYKTIRSDSFLEKGFGIGASYLGISPTLRIDYILSNASWKTKGWESLDENLSDHHMIMADLQLIKN